MVLVVENPMLEMEETKVRSLGWEDPQEEGMAIHSSCPRQTPAVMCLLLASPLTSTHSATVAGSPTPWPGCGGGREKQEPQGSWVKEAGEGCTE